MVVKKGNDTSNNVTKKLQKLVKQRKTPIVVTEQGSVKYYRHSSSESDGYSYSDSYDDN